MKTHVIYADLSEILFEERNKNYGGYVLRKTENANLAKGIFTALTAFALVFVCYFWFRSTPELVRIDNGPLELVEVSLPIQLPEKPTPPPPQPPAAAAAAAPASAQTETRNPIPVADTKADPNATLANQDSITGNPGLSDVSGPDNGSTGTKPGGTGLNPDGDGTGDQKKKEEVSSNSIFDDSMVSLSPSAKNMGTVKKGIIYPRALLESGFEGDVFFRVLVGTDGKIEEMKVLKSDHPLFTEACSRLIKKLEFSPGKMGEIPVRVWVTIPFKFRTAK